jgi:hypothetical protein
MNLSNHNETNMNIYDVKALTDSDKVKLQDLDTLKQIKVIVEEKMQISNIADSVVKNSKASLIEDVSVNDYYDTKTNQTIIQSILIKLKHNEIPI